MLLKNLSRLICSSGRGERAQLNMQSSTEEIHTTHRRTNANIVVVDLTDS